MLLQGGKSENLALLMVSFFRREPVHDFKATTFATLPRASLSLAVRTLVVQTHCWGNKALVLIQWTGPLRLQPPQLLQSQGKMWQLPPHVSCLPFHTSSSRVPCHAMPCHAMPCMSRDVYMVTETILDLNYWILGMSELMPCRATQTHAMHISWRILGNIDYIGPPLLNIWPSSCRGATRKPMPYMSLDVHVVA